MCVALFFNLPNETLNREITHAGAAAAGDIYAAY
jgi:hypothetical protein